MRHGPEGLRPWVHRHRFPLLIALAFIVGFLLRGLGGPERRAQAPGADETVEAAAVQAAEEWTCSMHPQIRQPRPGQCPICGMDLIPVRDGRSGAALPAGQVRLSETARVLAGVRTAPVERREVAHELRLAGTLEYDETRVVYLTAWVAGRLDRLMVDFTGERVRRGQPLASIYSPQLYAAQEELLQAVAAGRKAGAGTGSLERTAGLTVAAAREKLRQLGLSEQQLEQVIARGEPSTQVTISAPTGGTVVEKTATEGMYVATGDRLYTIADLSRLWVMLEAYETELPWVERGREVLLSTEAIPGESFRGTVEFVDPVVNPQTRTVGLRVEVPNPAGALKPGMFVHAVLRSELERAGNDSQPLVIPATAPLITGRRAVVYVADPVQEGVYAGREVQLGPRTGEYYVVSAGLAEGEQVVVSGNFKIDSEIQIMAGKSMMNPEGGPTGTLHQHGREQAPRAQSPAEEPAAAKAVSAPAGELPAAFERELAGVYQAFFRVQTALAADDLKTAIGPAAAALALSLDKPDMSLLQGESHHRWMERLGALEPLVARLRQAGGIEPAREIFERINSEVTLLVESFGPAGVAPILSYHCPMAFDNRGASWLQQGGEPRNPYFGDRMLRCHDTVDTLAAVAVPHQGHGGPSDE